MIQSYKKKVKFLSNSHHLLLNKVKLHIMENFFIPIVYKLNPPLLQTVILPAYPPAFFCVKNFIGWEQSLMKVYLNLDARVNIYSVYIYRYFHKNESYTFSQLDHKCRSSSLVFSDCSNTLFCSGQ